MAVLFGAGAGALTFGPVALAEIEAPGSAVGWDIAGAFVFFLGVLLVAILSLVLLVNRRTRLGAVVALLLLACSVGSNLVMMNVLGSIYWDARRGHFEQLALRSKPLVEAISDYERKLGRPPRTLDDLVPDYLIAVPDTGLDAYSEYVYQAFPDDQTDLRRVWYDLGPSQIGALSWLKRLGVDTGQAELVFEVRADGTVVNYRTEMLPPNIAKQSKFEAEKWSLSGQRRQAMVADLIERLRPVGRSLAEIKDALGDPAGERILRATAWQLSVLCSSGVNNFDVFFYWPSGAYPDYIYGGFVERIGGWSYVHE